MDFRRRIFLVGAILLAVALPAAGLDIPDFTFIHISDEHIYHPGTEETLAELAQPAEIYLKPYDVTAAAPSFIIESGDMTEFGPKAGAWNTLSGFYSKVPLERYSMQGNHDGTWRSLAWELRKLYGAPYYSFDKFGCHFVVLDSPGLQDPRPLIGPEQLTWLKKDLGEVRQDTPLFVALHHPIDTTEFSSQYEIDRLLDILRPYNLALIMVGHSHGFKHVPYRGIDMVHGGSSWGPGLPGYQVVSVRDGMLRIAYKERGKPAAETPTLEKPLAPLARRYPKITVHWPQERATYAGSMPVIAWVRLGKDEVKSAFVEIDGKNRTDLSRQKGGSFVASVPLDGLEPGAHYLKVTFAGADDSAYTQSRCFYVRSSVPSVRWRAFIPSAGKSTPALTRDAVYVGGFDGIVRKLDRATGKVKWEFAAGGAVAGEPAVVGSRIVFGSQDCCVYSVDAATGTQAWKYEADEPVLCPVAAHGGSLYFGTGSGALYCVDAASGEMKWKNTEATYTVEAKPFVLDGRVYYGAWDTYVYCVNAADGKQIWKTVGQGSAEGVAPAYYSPADSPVAVAGGKVFAPDRKYRMSVIDASAGALLSFVDGISAVGMSEDNSSIYVRKNKGQLARLRFDGSEIWSADVSMDDVPSAPVERGGTVYVCSKRGLVSAVSAVDGKVLWQYRATPSSYVFAGVAGDGRTAFVFGTDGSITCLTAK